jgi:alanyl-tRNA synthetase
MEVLMEGLKDIEDGQYLCLQFLKDYDRNSITRYLDSLIKSGKGIIAGVINEKANGYEYMFISDTVKLREYAGKINEALEGRGGGKDNVIQGSIRGDRKTIEEKVREVFGRNDYE